MRFSRLGGALGRPSRGRGSHEDGSYTLKWGIFPNLRVLCGLVDVLLGKTELVVCSSVNVWEEVMAQFSLGETSNRAQADPPHGML